MVVQGRKERRTATYKALGEKIGSILRKQYDALPMPRSDLLNDLMRRVEEAEIAREKNKRLH
jgi:hypothetical protein